MGERLAAESLGPLEEVLLLQARVGLHEHRETNLMAVHTVWTTLLKKLKLKLYTADVGDLSSRPSAK